MPARGAPTLDPQIAELYARRDEAGIQPTFAGSPSGPECRERYASFRALITKPGLPEGMSREERRLGRGGSGSDGVPVVIFRPQGATDRVIAFFHGGGFVVGSPDSHLDHAARLAEATGAGLLADA